MNRFIQAFKLMNKSAFEKNLHKITSNTIPISPEIQLIDSNSFLKPKILNKCLGIINDLKNISVPVKEIDLFMETLKKQTEWLPILKLMLISHTAVHKIGPYFIKNFTNFSIESILKLAQAPKELSISK